MSKLIKIKNNKNEMYITEGALSCLLGKDVTISGIVYSRDEKPEDVLMADIADEEIVVSAGKNSHTMTIVSLPTYDTPFLSSALYGSYNGAEDEAIAHVAYGRVAEEDNSPRVLYVREDINVHPNEEWAEAPVLITEKTSVSGSINRYLVSVSEGFSRDTQICVSGNTEEPEEGWTDVSAPILLGLYDAFSPDLARKKAAQEHGIPEEIIDAEEI